MDNSSIKSMVLDGIFASEAIDSSGEQLSIDGADISQLIENGSVNYEHLQPDKNKNQGQEMVGRVIYAKKIFEAKDCDNDRQLEYWDKVKLPFIYGIARLSDGAGHESARALAATIRDHYAHNEPLMLRWSIEGTTLEKDKSTNTITSCIARRVALTARPCNRPA